MENFKKAMCEGFTTYYSIEKSRSKWIVTSWGVMDGIRSRGMSYKVDMVGYELTMRIIREAGYVRI